MAMWIDFSAERQVESIMSDNEDKLKKSAVDKAKLSI